MDNLEKNKETMENVENIGQDQIGNIDVIKGNTKIIEQILREQADDKPVQKTGVKYFFKCLSKSKTAVFGAVIIAILVLMAIFAPLISPNDPRNIVLIERLRPPMWQEGGTSQFPLGTDSLGRCVLSRIVYGSRVSLIVGFLAVFMSGAIGVVLGMVSGYFGGLVDDIIMRLTDIMMAFPFVLLAIAILAVLGSGLQNVIIVLAITGWTQYARLVRSEVISYRSKEFVEAAKALGLPTSRIIFRHIMPNIMSSVIVVASFAFAGTIISEASLSFLGLGVSPDTPTWGAMISDAREYIYVGWWLAIFPGIAMVLTILGINLFGDWLRDYLDPKTLNY